MGRDRHPSGTSPVSARLADLQNAVHWFKWPRNWTRRWLWATGQAATPQRRPCTEGIGSRPTMTESGGASQNAKKDANSVFISRILQLMVFSLAYWGCLGPRSALRGVNRAFGAKYGTATAICNHGASGLFRRPTPKFADRRLIRRRGVSCAQNELGYRVPRLVKEYLPAWQSILRCCAVRSVSQVLRLHHQHSDSR